MPSPEIKYLPVELERYQARLKFGAGFVLVLTLILATRLIYLQLVKHEHYQELAESNRITLVPAIPNRGVIYDRNGKILADNFSGYTLEITVNENSKLSVANLSQRIEFFRVIMIKSRRRWKALTMKTIKKILFEIFRWPFATLFWLSGWRINRETIEDDKIVLTGAPHTTNWDYIVFLFAAITLRRKIYVTVKKEAFKFPPLAWFIRAVGGISIDRASSHNVVDQLAEQLKSREKMVLLFTPEGTRSYRPYWKTGFYWTAVEAVVPIMLGIPDYPKKKIYLHVRFMPSGDIEKDFEMIREAQEKYGVGLYPEKTNPVVRPKEDSAEAQVWPSEV